MPAQRSHIMLRHAVPRVLEQSAGGLGLAGMHATTPCTLHVAQPAAAYLHRGC